MVAVLALDAPGRLSRLLLILADEYGAKTPEGIQIDARIPQSDLADWIGVVPVIAMVAIGIGLAAILNMRRSKAGTERLAAGTGIQTH